MADRLETVVPPEAAGMRLDAWLAGLSAIRTRSLAQRLIEGGNVQVDGRRRPKGHRVSAGEHVSVELQAAARPQEAIAAQPDTVLEDDHLLVIDKPAGVVVHPAPGHRSKTLVEALAPEGGSWRPHVVHRLDRDTSGLMLVAKDEQTAEELRRAIKGREVVREYLALVKGRPAAKAGTIDAPIGRDPRRRTRMSTRATRAREARTHFEVEELLEGFTLVRARLETGRTHQIRAHFAAAGTPVCGDPEYGGKGLLGLERQFLHSARLSFVHPHGGRRVELSSALPADLREALDRARGGSGTGVI
jgi:23S rRNA pseudouridine1911/1915/1917 synthase